MTKPTDTATWATDTDYSSGPYGGTPTKVPFDTGEAERGHVPAAKTAAQKQNSWQNTVHLWCAYVDELTSAKWKWVHGITLSPGAFVAAQNGNGLLGTVAEQAFGSTAVDLPVGAKITKVGIRYRHITGETPAAVTGGVALWRITTPTDGLGGNTTIGIIQSDPPTSMPASFTLEVLGVNATTWETIIVDLDEDEPLVIEDLISYVIEASCSGAAYIGAVGYEYLLAP